MRICAGLARFAKDNPHRVHPLPLRTQTRFGGTHVGAVVDKLPWIVYLAMWAVAVGYWVVPVQPRARSTDALAIERLESEPPRIAPEPTTLAMATMSVPADRPSWSGVTVVPALPAIPPSSPGLLERMRPVLKRGTNLAKASADFTDAMEFAAVAHAAQHTNVPFMLLKQRVVHEGMTLADAIRASQPDADAEVEADLALAKARADVSALVR